MPPDRGLATVRRSGTKGNKSRLTYLFCVNGDGSDKRQPFVIGHSARPRCFNKKNGADLGFDYAWNSKTWMTRSLFHSYAHHASFRNVEDVSFLLMRIIQLDQKFQHRHATTTTPSAVVARQLLRSRNNGTRAF